MESLIKSICTIPDLVQTTDCVFQVGISNTASPLQCIAAVFLLPPGSHWLKDHQAWDRPPCSTPPTLPRSTTQVWKGIEEVIICYLQYQNGLTKKGRISWMCKHYQPKSNESVLNLWEQPKSTESLVKCEEKKLLCHLQVPSLLFSRTVSNLYHSLLLQVQRLFHWGL